MPGDTQHADTQHATYTVSRGKLVVVDLERVDDLVAEKFSTHDWVYRVP